MRALLPAALLCAAPLAGQGRGHLYEIAAGAAVPSGILGVRGSAGTVVRMGIRTRDGSGPLRYRLDAEALAISTRSRTRASPSTADDSDGVRAASVVYSVIAGPTREGLAPYAIVGAGIQAGYSLRPDTWPWIWPTLRFGVGVRGQVGRYGLAAEITSVGALQRYNGGGYWPITVSMAF